MSNPATQFKKGKSGNSKGAPKRNWTWAGEYQKAVERKNLDNVPVKQAIAEALVDQSIQGNVIAIKELTNRMDGMPAQPQEIQGKLEVEVKIRP